MYQNSKSATVYAQNKVMMYQQELLIQQRIFLLVTKASCQNSRLDQDGDTSRTGIPMSWHTLFKRINTRFPNFRI
jgi:hypothetical protein